MVHCRGKFVELIFHVNSDNERDVGLGFLQEITRNAEAPASDCAFLEGLWAL